MLILDPINWDGDDIDLACGTINGIAQTFSFSGTAKFLLKAPSSTQKP